LQLGASNITEEDHDFTSSSIEDSDKEQLNKDGAGCEGD
jgi:hypothetical protein